MALRFILEDGKLNVCLRNLAEWREFHRKRRDATEEADERPLVRRKEKLHHVLLSLALKDIPGPGITMKVKGTG